MSHPTEMQGASQDSYTEQAALNFVYVTAIPNDFQNGTEIAYNYDPTAADLLLNVQVGEAKPVHANPDMAQWFTFTRQPDITIGDQVAQAYDNTQPWEFPAGTKEIRYYLKTNDCIYQFGGYLDITDEDLFNQIVATFQVKPWN